MSEGANGYIPEGSAEPPPGPRPQRGGFADPAVRAKAAATRAAKAASMRDTATAKDDRAAETAANRVDSRRRREQEAAELQEAREQGIRRADGTVRRRRRVMDGLRDSTLTRAIEVELDHETYVYRWANDELGRIDRLWETDWDRVDGQKTVPSGASRTRPGEARHKVLLRKRRDDFLEDLRARNARVNAALDAQRSDPLGAGGLRAAAYEASREAGLAGETGRFYVREGWQNGYEQGAF